MRWNPHQSDLDGDDPTSGGTGLVRFVPSDVPVLTSCPADRTGAIRAAGRTLAEMGRSYLGGHLEIRATGTPRLARSAERLAAVRAVQNVLRGGCGSVRFPVPPRWPAGPGCPGDADCPCPGAGHRPRSPGPPRPPGPSGPPPSRPPTARPHPQPGPGDPTVRQIDEKS
ncbi:hypothetical protein GCM10012279_28720 [Micromonospora yangpuensis]|nr:hypothetical protein GCM10012279_28720 [Micromonospora yangpuensis]